MDDLKKRSYLAQFLVKLDVPPEMLGDPDISFLYEQYESQIEEFKDTHKKYEALKSSGMSITELRTDITAMEKEKDSVEKKIEKLRQRVGYFNSTIVVLCLMKVVTKNSKQTCFLVWTF